MSGPDSLEDLNAVKSRHENVEQHDIEFLMSNQIERHGPIARLNGLEPAPLETPPQYVAVGLDVVDDQKSTFGSIHLRHEVTLAARRPIARLANLNQKRLRKGTIPSPARA